MSLTQKNQSKVPLLTPAKTLKQLKGKVLFPEKLAKANDILSKTGLPKLKTQVN
jgi:hypothetical protein